MTELLRDHINDPALLSPHRVPTGLIPASGTIPDIFYANDFRSANTALVTYLSYLHLNREIQARVLPCVNKLICAVSPMAGGRRMESCARAGLYQKPLTQPVPFAPESLTSNEQTYLGRVDHQSHYVAVYATSDEGDQSSGFTRQWTEHVEEYSHRHAGVRCLDDFYHAVLDRPQDESSLPRLLDLLTQPDSAEKSRQLAQMFLEMARAPYKNIPGTLGHELGHVLDRTVLNVILKLHPKLAPKHPSPVSPYPNILFQEIGKIISQCRNDLSYFRTSREAWAELIGAALTEQMEMNMGLDPAKGRALHTDGLADLLSESYNLISEAVEWLSIPPQPKRTPALFRPAELNL